MGPMTLGEFAGYPLPRTHDIAWEFKRCGITTRVVADLAEARWRKLVWNIPFQRPDAARNGPASGGEPSRSRRPGVLADDALAYLARRLMDEVIVSPRANSGTRSRQILPSVQMKRTAEMKPYLPSTLVDHLAGRALELDAIWGEPYRRAFNAGAEVGRLETLYYLLRALDRPR